MPFIVLVTATVAALSSARAQDFNADRPGGDFASVTLGQGASPYDCERLCKADGRCQAWTYVNAGLQDQIHPRCWLKSSVPPRRESKCCVTGLKYSNWRFNTNLPGGDYNSVTLPSGATATECYQLCGNERACRGWTYVKAGYQGPTPRCWLKNRVGAMVPNPCCTSEIVWQR
jgi:PAN domain